MYFSTFVVLLSLLIVFVCLYSTLTMHGALQNNTKRVGRICSQLHIWLVRFEVQLDSFSYLRNIKQVDNTQPFLIQSPNHLCTLGALWLAVPFLGLRVFCGTGESLSWRFWVLTLGAATCNRYALQLSYLYVFANLHFLCRKGKEIYILHTLCQTCFPTWVFPCFVLFLKK